MKLLKMTFWVKVMFISINLSIPTQSKGFKLFIEYFSNHFMLLNFLKTPKTPILVHFGKIEKILKKILLSEKKLEIKQRCSDHFDNSFLTFQIHNCPSKNYCRLPKMQSARALIFSVMTTIFQQKH